MPNLDRGEDERGFNEDEGRTRIDGEGGGGGWAAGDADGREAMVEEGPMVGKEMAMVELRGDVGGCVCMGFRLWWMSMRSRAENGREE